MLLKKFFLRSIVASILTLPWIAHAADLPSLFTTNHTKEYSVAKVKGSGNCSGTFNKITDPGKTLETKNTELRTICSFTAPCSATIIMSKTEADAKACKGTEVTTAVISDLNTAVVTKITTPVAAPYKISGVGTNKVTISY